MIGITPAALIFSGRYELWTAHHPASLNALSIADRDTALCTLDEDDRRDADEHDEQDEHGGRDTHAQIGLKVDRREDRRRNRNDDRGEDDERHAITNTTLRDELAIHMMIAVPTTNVKTTKKSLKKPGTSGLNTMPYDADLNSSR